MNATRTCGLSVASRAWLFTLDPRCAASAFTLRKPSFVAVDGRRRDLRLVVLVFLSFFRPRSSAALDNVGPSRYDKTRIFVRCAPLAFFAPFSLSFDVATIVAVTVCIREETLSAFTVNLELATLVAEA